MYIFIIMFFVFIFLCFINRYFQRDWSFHSIEMERQKRLEEEKEWLYEKCGINTPPEGVPKESPKCMYI